MIQEKRNDQLVDDATDLFKSDDDREYFEIDNGLIKVMMIENILKSIMVLFLTMMK